MAAGIGIGIGIRIRITIRIRQRHLYPFIELVYCCNVSPAFVANYPLNVSFSHNEGWVYFLVVACVGIYMVC